MATVLVVDDDTSLRALLGELLTECGYTVLQAGDGGAALDQIQRQVPQLVLSDVTLPVMDGLELCHTLRARPDTAALPVILMSAVACEDAETHACADATLLKPFDLDALEALVQHWLPRTR